MEVLYQLSYPGAGLTVARGGGALEVAFSGVEREALAVHSGRGIRAEEGDGVGQILGRGEGGTVHTGAGLADLRRLDGVDDDDVGGGVGAHEGVGEGEGPRLGSRLGRGVGGVGVL